MSRATFYLKQGIVWFYFEGPTTTPSASLTVDVPAEELHKRNYPIAYREFLDSQKIEQEVKEVMVESSEKQVEAKTLIAEPLEVIESQPI